MICILIQCGQPNTNTWISNLLDSIAKADGQSLIQYSAIIAGFISITVPIALDIVAKHTEDFKDKEISRLFLNSWLYRFQLYINLSIVFVSILLITLKFGGVGWSLFILFADLGAIIVFILFIRRVQQFATNFADYYSSRLKKESDEIVQGK